MSSLNYYSYLMANGCHLIVMLTSVCICGMRGTCWWYVEARRSFPRTIVEDNSNQDESSSSRQSCPGDLLNRSGSRYHVLRGAKYPQVSQGGGPSGCTRHGRVRGIRGDRSEDRLCGEWIAICVSDAFSFILCQNNLVKVKVRRGTMTHVSFIVQLWQLREKISRSL